LYYDAIDEGNIISTTLIEYTVYTFLKTSQGSYFVLIVLKYIKYNT